MTTDDETPEMAAIEADRGDGDVVEVEWQLAARDLRPVRRWLARGAESTGHRVEPLDVVTLVDTYWDTVDWRFHAAGVALRVRRVGGAVEATLKALTPAVDGLARRREITEVLDAATPGSVADAPGPVGARVRAVLGRAALRPLFVVRTRRHRFALVRLGVLVGEVTLDATTIAVDDGPPARLRRVEVEARAGDPDAAAPFVAALAAACRLEPARASKYQAGLAACGLAPVSAVPELGATAVGPTSTIGEVAFAALRRHLATLLRTEPGTRLGDDAEALHDMRVAARRLRAVLRVFRPWLPRRAEALELELDWVNEGLGGLRDLDVQLERVAALRAAAPREAWALEVVARALAEERGAARTALLRVLDARRYERLVARLMGFVRRGPLRSDPAARAPIGAVAPDLVRRAFRRLARSASRLHGSSPPDALHAVRIRARRLRYTLEALSGLYGKPLRRMLEALVALQDVLGSHQDAVVLETRLEGLVHPPLRVSPDVGFAVGRLAEREAELAAALRRRVPAAWRRVHGKRWRKLARALDAPP